MIQARKRVFALSIYDPGDKIKWRKGSNQRTLKETLNKIFESKEYLPKNIWGLNNIFDFENKHKDESYLCQIKKTPSRIMMIKNGLYINNKNNIRKISTITTKQDRWPNLGYVDYLNPRKDKKGIPYTNKRFVTPRETYRLMGFDNKMFNKAKKEMELTCVSNISAREKLYKQAGNSIAVNVLEMIFYYIQKGEY